MADNKTIEKRLAKLTDNIRLTVQVIHAQYREGNPIRYQDIKKARMAAGMHAGSESTIKKAFQCWRDIYDIEEKTFNSPVEIDQLVRQVIRQVRGEVERHYRQEAELKMADAEERADLIGNRLKECNSENVQYLAQIEALTEKLQALRFENDASIAENETLLAQTRSLDKEASNLRVTIAGLEKQVSDKAQQVMMQEKAVDSLRSDMESQRQAQLVLLDERVQEVKRATKTMDALRCDVAARDKKNTALVQDLAKANDSVTLLTSKITEMENAYETTLMEKVQDLQTLQERSEQQTIAIEKLTNELDKERALRTQQREGLITEIEQLIAKSQKTKKQEKDRR